MEKETLVEKTQQTADVHGHKGEPHPIDDSTPLTGLWYGVVDKDKDSLLRVELDPLADHVNELAWDTHVARARQSRHQRRERMKKEFGLGRT